MTDVKSLTPLNARLLIVRHGQTDWNITHRFQGQSDVPLNTVGEQQAHAAGRALAAPGFKLTASGFALSAEPGGGIQAIYASDLSRARRTAEIIAEHLAASGQAAPPITLEPRLREMDFGEWEGLTYTEIQQRTPEALSRWEADLERYAPPGGEMLRALAQRVAQAQADILGKHPTGITLLVSHGGPLQMWIALALGLAQRSFWQIHLSNASISELAVYPEGAILNVLNACHHLQE